MDHATPSLVLVPRWTGQNARRALALVCGLLVALLLAEVGLRVTGVAARTERLPLSYDIAAIDQIAAGDNYVAFDSELGWLPAPAVERTDGKVIYRHNRAGQRANSEYAQAPPPGQRRISAYGDSFTYCQEVQIEECWTEQLREGLDDTEVVNFGVPGGAPDQAWLRYQRDGVSWQPCAVLIGHMTENINRVVNRFRPFYEPHGGIPLAKPRFRLEEGRTVLVPSPSRSPEQLKDPSWVERNLGPGDDWYFPGMFVAGPLDSLVTFSMARTARYRIERTGVGDATVSWTERIYRPGSAPLELLVAILAEFSEQVRRDGATPIVLIFPKRAEIIGYRDGAPKPHAALLEALRQRGVTTIDLTDVLGEQAKRFSVSRMFLKSHYDASANTFIGRALAGRVPRLTERTCGA